MKKLALISVMIWVLACGSSQSPFTPLKKPVGIALATESILFQTRNTKLAYVADEFTQSLVVLDTLRDEIVDTVADDEFDYTPVPVGGQPSAVAVDTTDDHHRIFVSDRLNNQLLAYEMTDNSPSTDIVRYKPLSLGGPEEGRASRPLFKEAGALSDPTMTSITVDPDHAKNESWRLNYIGNERYEVFGSQSGKQTGIARQGEFYTSDNNEVKFYVSAGGQRTTNDDQFFFGTIVTRPLPLAASPVHMITHDRKLYILTSDAPSIVVFDLDSLDVEATIAIPDVNALPVNMSLLNDKIYVSNLNSSDVYEFDIISLTFATIPTGLSNPIRSVGAYDGKLYLVHNAEPKVTVWDIQDASTIKTLNLTDFGNSFFITQINTTHMGFVPNVSGNLDIIKLSNNQRIDTQLDDKEDFFGLEFFDVSPVSAPQLISVNGVAGKVQNEVWQMVFEGIIPQVNNLEGTITGDQLVATTTFQDFGVQAGDVVVVPDENKQYVIEAVDSQTTLTLVTTPSIQGDFDFEVRANDSYVMVGSKSGVQQNRVVPGETYTSDSGSISLKTRPSFNSPETRGDFFVFQTTDPIDPLYINNQGMAISGISFQNSEGRYIGYILEQTKGQISIVDLGSYEVRRTL